MDQDQLLCYIDSFSFSFFFVVYGLYIKISFIFGFLLLFILMFKRQEMERSYYILQLFYLIHEKLLLLIYFPFFNVFNSYNFHIHSSFFPSYEQSQYHLFQAKKSIIQSLNKYMDQTHAKCRFFIIILITFQIFYSLDLRKNYHLLSI